VHFKTPHQGWGHGSRHTASASKCETEFKSPYRQTKQNKKIQQQQNLHDIVAMYGQKGDLLFVLFCHEYSLCLKK
jgi:hypothetical protein